MGVALAWSLFQPGSPRRCRSRSAYSCSTIPSRAPSTWRWRCSYIRFSAAEILPRGWIPVQDWIIGLLGAFCAAYLFLFYVQLAGRPGQPTTFDLVVAAGGLLFLLEVTRRVVGLPMAIMAIIFIGYIFLGPYMPDMIAHKGAPFSKAMSHLWLSTEGLRRRARRFVGLRLPLCALRRLVDTGGAGNYFIKSALSLLGHMRGGPAKAAVVSWA